MFMPNILFPLLTLSFLQTNADTYAKSVDPDETAHDEPSHLDQHCLPFYLIFLAEFPICINGCVQIQRCKSQLWKLRGERVYFC